MRDRKPVIWSELCSKETAQSLNYLSGLFLEGGQLFDCTLKVGLSTWLVKKPAINWGISCSAPKRASQPREAARPHPW